ncbi:2-aminoadipate transaminase [Nakamurella sp. UYEF19]|uniref:aminotransferase-like domain-containing protein n=1 Tax=Nakamurella sp. UYEF19 TaxID=1756392 RepID=UPI003390872D
MIPPGSIPPAPIVPAPIGDVAVARRVSALSVAAPYALPTRGFRSSVIRLVSGAPAPEALPLDDFGRTAAELFADAGTGAAALAYGPHAGQPALRDWIAGREGVDLSSVLVTNGALHGVALAFGALLEQGDVVVLDDPVFPDTVRIAEQYGARVLPVRVGPEGIDVQRIEDHLLAGVRIRIVYTVADFHNPSGGVLPAKERARLVELAEQYGFVIVSDNPYRDTTFDGSYVEDFATGSPRVIKVGTFTKTLGAGLRLGWVIAPVGLLGHLENLRRRTDFHSSTLSQELILPLLNQPGWFDNLLVHNRSVHRAKAEVFVDALRAELIGDLQFTAPAGGFFVWARLADHAPAASDVVTAAAERDLLLTSGRHFAPDGGSQWDRHLRFAFSAPTLSELPVAVGRLRAALDACR